MGKNSYQVSEELDGPDRIGLVVWAMKVPERKVAESLTKFANEGNESALRWAKRLVDHGVTDTMRSELVRIVGRVKFRSQMKLDSETGGFVWNYTIPLAKSVEDDYVVFAFMVARLLDSSGAFSIKQCALPTDMKKLAKKYPSLREKVRTGKYDCKNFFVGNAKARYCHDNCGARFRIAERRCRDKANQMLGNQML